MPSCAVKGCGISEYHIRKTGSSVSLHVFPKNESQSKRWESFCGPRLKPGKRYICSEHFERQDFDNVYSSNIRRVLRKSGKFNIQINIFKEIHDHYYSAVPSICKAETSPLSDRSVRAQRKARKEMIAELMETYQNAKVNDNAESFKPLINSTFNDSNNHEHVELGVEEIDNFDAQFEAANKNSPENDAETSLGNFDVLWEAMLIAQSSENVMPNQSSDSGVADAEIFPESDSTFAGVKLSEHLNFEPRVNNPKQKSVSRLAVIIKSQRQTIRSLRAQVRFKKKQNVSAVNIMLFCR